MLTCKACIDDGNARIDLQLQARAAHEVVNEELQAFDLHQSATYVAIPLSWGHTLGSGHQSVVRLPFDSV